MFYQIYVTNPHEGRCIIVDEGLANELGMNPSIMLLRLNAVINQAAAVNHHIMFDGIACIQTSLNKMSKHWFPYWSRYQVTKAASELESAGILFMKEDPQAGLTLFGIKDLSSLKSVHVEVLQGVVKNLQPLVNISQPPVKNSQPVYGGDDPKKPTSHSYIGDGVGVTPGGVVKNLQHIYSNSNYLSIITTPNPTEEEIELMRQTEQWQDMCNAVMSVTPFVSILSLSEGNKGMIDELLRAGAKTDVIKTCYSRDAGSFWDQHFRSTGKNGRKRSPYPKDILDTYSEAEEFHGTNALPDAADAQKVEVI